MATHARGLICLCLTGERCEELGLPQMTAAERSAPRHRVHGLGRSARGRDDRHLGGRPRAHDPRRDRSRLDAARPRPARPRLPAARAGRRCARPRRPDRGCGRPRASRRARPGRRHLRDHERGRDDGPCPRSRAVLRAARAADGHRRRPDRVPAADGEAHRARRDRAACRRSTATSPRSRFARRSPAATTSPS